MANAVAATECSVWYDTLRRRRSGVSGSIGATAPAAWVQLARMTLVPAVLEGTDLASGLDLADRGTL